MKTIIFFDIDGTLGHHGHIPQYNLEALKQLKDKGYLTFICTGRSGFYAQNLFQDLVSGYVCCNGRYILYQGQKLYGHAFNQEELNNYQRTFDHYHIGAMLVSDDAFIPYHLNEDIITSLKKEYGDSHLSNDSTLPIYTFDLFYQDKNHLETIKNIYKNHLVINDHPGHDSCDCSTINFDKGDGITYLLNYFNIDKDHAYAFGDGDNDLAMMNAVSHSIAMGNAIDSLKEKATYVTESLENQGIPLALKHFGLL